jgi:hypothetical protein
MNIDQARHENLIPSPSKDGHRLKAGKEIQTRCTSARARPRIVTGAADLPRRNRVPASPAHALGPGRRGFGGRVRLTSAMAIHPGEGNLARFPVAFVGLRYRTPGPGQEEIGGIRPRILVAADADQSLDGEIDMPAAEIAQRFGLFRPSAGISRLALLKWHEFHILLWGYCGFH